MPVKNASIRRTRLGALGLLLVLGLAVCGQGCAEDPPRSSPPGPPRAAIDACLYKAFSASCYFEDGPHAITGTCQERGRDWVCVPDRATPGGAGAVGLGSGSAAAPARPRSTSGSAERAPRPPQEAFEACLNRAAGSACSVRTPRGEIAGRCSTELYGLVCIPMDPGHRPGEEGRAEFSRR
jgi:hypothetical protein